MLQAFIIYFWGRELPLRVIFILQIQLLKLLKKLSIKDVQWCCQNTEEFSLGKAIINYQTVSSTDSASI